MNENDLNDAETGDSRPTSVPANLNVRVVGIEDMSEFTTMLTPLFTNMGRTLDLSSLDGVTFAIDYPTALKELDRGYASSHTLTPSGGRVAGIAMTPTVIRDGQLKSHIVIDLNVFVGMLADGRGDRVVQLIAHECAHVEANAQFDRAFPNVLLRQQVNYRDGLRSQIFLACWDEYIACLRSAPFGEDPRADYERTFLEYLGVARDEADTSITEYRLHSDVSRVICEVSEVYSNVMKYAAYYLGNEVGQGRDWRKSETVSAALDCHWFLPFFERLETALDAIAQNRGEWQDRSAFEAIADLGEDLMEDGGMCFYDSPTHPGEIGVDLPLTPQTTPHWDPRSSRSAPSED
jgi:hypothetical protein